MIGIDTVDVERLRGLLDRVPSTEKRLFTQAEREHSRLHADPIPHLAGTLAVKEAVIKATSLGPLVAWCRRIEVFRDDAGAPRVRIEEVDRPIAVSISHDGGIAVAVAFVTRPRPGTTTPRAMAASRLKPNEQLMGYLGFATG